MRAQHSKVEFTKRPPGKGMGGAILLLCAALAHCGGAASDNPPGASGTSCTCPDGSACPAGGEAQCSVGTTNPTSKTDAGASTRVQPSDDAGASTSSTGDGGSGITSEVGPFCVSYTIMEEFYANPTEQCTCQDAWAHEEDAENYVGVLDFYPGIYANAHVVRVCPILECCIRQSSDDGGTGLAAPGCLCSDATIDCTNNIYTGASATQTCP